MKGHFIMKKDADTKKLPSFYIALCCCVIAIGVAGFIIQGDESQTTDTPAVAEKTHTPQFLDEEVLTEPVAEVAQSPATPTEIPVIDSVPADVGIEDYAYDNPDVVSAAVVVNAEESCEFTDPVPEMTVKFGFINDTLVYNECYGDWRTHNGIDIEAPVGCSVSATAAGTVIESKKSSYGNTVTIEHPNGFKSVYSQLGEISVKVGDTVKQGAVIGTVGECMGENLKEPHLHYELYKDSKPVNPEEY